LLHITLSKERHQTATGPLDLEFRVSQSIAEAEVHCDWDAHAPKVSISPQSHPTIDLVVPNGYRYQAGSVVDQPISAFDGEDVRERSLVGAFSKPVVRAFSALH
jgi:hypothetical protein